MKLYIKKDEKKDTEIQKEKIKKEKYNITKEYKSRWQKILHKGLFVITAINK